MKIGRNKPDIHKETLTRLRQILSTQNEIMKRQEISISKWCDSSLAFEEQVKELTHKVAELEKEIQRRNSFWWWEVIYQARTIQPVLSKNKE